MAAVALMGLQHLPAREIGENDEQRRRTLRTHAREPKPERKNLVGANALQLAPPGAALLTKIQKVCDDQPGNQAIDGPTVERLTTRTTKQTAGTGIAPEDQPVPTDQQSRLGQRRQRGAQEPVPDGALR